MRTYAIGDVHGELALLERALAWIDGDAGTEPATVVLTGDYVDRGPDSRGVIDRLMRGPRRPSQTWVPLAGNHEILFLGARSSRTHLQTWMANGGQATVDSYRRAGAVKVPEAHFEWIAGLPAMYAADGRVFVHAAVDTSRAYDDQLRDTMSWGRYDVATYVRRPLLIEGVQQLIVHGHTPCHMPKYAPGVVLNIDTGAGHGDDDCRLSVAAWRDGEEHPRVAQFGPARDHVLTWDERLLGGTWKVTS